MFKKIILNILSIVIVTGSLQAQNTSSALDEDIRYYAEKKREAEKEKAELLQKRNQLAKEQAFARKATSSDPQLFKKAQQYVALINEAELFKKNIITTIEILKEQAMLPASLTGGVLGALVAVPIILLLAKAEEAGVAAGFTAGGAVAIPVMFGIRQLAGFWGKWKTGLTKINRVMKKYTTIEPLKLSIPEFALILAAYRKNAQDVALIATQTKPFISKKGVMQALAGLMYDDPIIGSVKPEYVKQMQKVINSEQLPEEKLKQYISYAQLLEKPLP